MADNEKHGLKLTAFTYVALESFEDGTEESAKEGASKKKWHRSVTFGPKQGGWVFSNGKPDPEKHEVSQIVVDLAEDGSVIGVEFLDPSVIEYYGNGHE